MFGSDPIDFATQIKPLLSDRCFLCHGPDAEHRQADLRLDTPEGAFAALASDESAHGIVPGKPDDSALVARIFADDDSIIMPPEESGLSLSPAEKQLLVDWIAQGAQWKGHWAFQPIKRPTPPQVGNDQWCRNDIDRFIVAAQEREGLTQNSMADRAVLIRRATFDLTGLPPTLEEIDAFLADQSPNAFEKVVDRLLNSPHFGERMASEWLDVARYSDTYGYQVDRDRYVWPWRDWVIKAFNDNKPFDDFIVEQLAGDLLPNANRDQILATTFNRLHPQKVEGGSVPEEFRVEYVADRAQTTATAFLGLTLECCRCHDHKYDPLSQKEYFQMFAFFNSIDEAGLYSYFTNSVPTPTLPLTTAQQETQLRQLRSEIATAEQNLQTSVTAAAQDKNFIKQFLAQNKTELIGQLAHFDFDQGNFSANEIVDGYRDKAVRLTGDHGIDVKVGNFNRWQPFSVSAWLQSPKKFERAVVWHRSRAWTDAASRGYELLLEDGHLSAALVHFYPGNAIRIRSVDPIPLNQWMQVTVTYDGSSSAEGMAIYVDGKRVPCTVVKNSLTKKISGGGGGDTIQIGQRFRDKGFKQGLIDDFQVFNRKLTEIEIRHLVDGEFLTKLFQRPVESLNAEECRELAELASASDADLKLLHSSLMKTREKFYRLQDSLTEIMVMKELKQPRPAYVLTRGAYDAPAEKVRPEVPSALPALEKADPANRLGLARWLTADSHPLTARVTVNRYWQLLFGEGLVRTPEDFGNQGMIPSHPKLLDWLAADFKEHGWDLKRSLKQIIMSATYQQSSQATADLHKHDPENMWLARSPVHRLNAEMLRDNALAASGLLVRKIGGPPVKPYELASAFKPAKVDTGERLYRRSLYTYWQRTAPAPVMIALDASKRDVCRVKRERTASPLQALVVLNGPQFVEAGRVLADKLLNQHKEDDRAILTDMFRLLTSRQPTDADMKILQTLAADQIRHFQKHPQEVEKYLNVGDQKIDTLTPVRLAALASVANTLLAFDESMMRR